MTRDGLILFNLNANMMETLKLKGRFNEIKGKLKQKFANLTDDDLLYEEGEDDELYGRLQQKLGKSKEEIQELINSYLK